MVLARGDRCEDPPQPTDTEAGKEHAEAQAEALEEAQLVEEGEHAAEEENADVDESEAEEDIEV